MLSATFGLQNHCATLIIRPAEPLCYPQNSACRTTVLPSTPGLQNHCATPDNQPAEPLIRATLGLQNHCAIPSTPGLQSRDGCIDGTSLVQILALLAIHLPKLNGPACRIQICRRQFSAEYILYTTIVHIHYCIKSIKNSAKLIFSLKYSGY